MRPLLPSATAHRRPISAGDLAWLVTVASLLVVAIVYPIGIDPYSLATIRDSLLFGLFALSLDLLWGKTGMLSFGHATFFGLGAYAMAVVTIKVALPLSIGCLMGLFVGILSAGGVSLMVGYFLIFGGVRGAYFTIVTLAMSLIAQQIAIGWSAVTGGDAGLIGIPPFTIGHYRFSDLPFYYLILGVCTLILLGAWTACRGRYGRLLAAIQDHELRAQTLGYHTSLHLLIIFVMSAIIAALAGGLYAAATGFVAPDMIGLLLSTEVIVWVVVGGRGTLVGAFVGSLVVTQVQDQISSVDTKLWPLAMGLFFIAMVFLFPDGLIGLLEPVRRLVARRWSTPGGARYGG